MSTSNTVLFVSQVDALRNLVDIVGDHLDKTLVDFVKFREEKLNLQYMVFIKIHVFLTVTYYVDVINTHRCGLEIMSNLLWQEQMILQELEQSLQLSSTWGISWLHKNKLEVKVFCIDIMQLSKLAILWI